MRFEFSGGVILFLVLMMSGDNSMQAVHISAQLSKEEVHWRAYLGTFLSEGYIEEHFRLHRIHKPPSGPSTLSYVIKYGDVVVHTRTLAPGNGGLISGITRISEKGEILSYFGPLKEYELRVGENQAVAIMRKHGCVLDGSGSWLRLKGNKAEGELALRLFVGDYWEKTGRYSPDYIPEGFYWVGGAPPRERVGTECLVDAETGKFGIKRVAPH